MADVDNNLFNKSLDRSACKCTRKLYWHGIEVSLNYSGVSQRSIVFPGHNFEPFPNVTAFFGA